MMESAGSLLSYLELNGIAKKYMFPPPPFFVIESPDI